MQSQPHTSISESLLKIIEEELSLHERVKLAVREEALTKSPDVIRGVHERLKELRDEAISASERDLPSLFQQLYTHHSLAGRDFRKKLPDMRAPYFARLQLHEKEKQRDILIGHQTFIDSKSGITIIDWRHATLAKVFFNFKEGDDYELELPGRLAFGTLAIRRVLTFDMGELVGITGPNFSVVRQRQGAWHLLDSVSVPTLAGGSGTSISSFAPANLTATRKLPDVSALLDPKQYEILNRDDSTTLLILGGAGSGKTTIALHRIALLNYRKPKFYSQNQMQVVVPEQGLVRFTKRILSNLDLDDVSVETFDSWVQNQASNLLQGLPKKLCEWTSSSVIAIKRHPAMSLVLDAYAQIITNRIADKMQFLFDQDLDVVDEFKKNQFKPIASRLESAEQKLKERFSKKNEAWKLATLQSFLKEWRHKLNDVESVRSELFVNPDLLAILKQSTQGELNESALNELIRHTQKQFEEPLHLKHDKEQMKTKEVDGSDLEIDDYAGTLDVEDYPILLSWLEKVYGRVSRKGKSLTLYKHLVIDEAQDLSQLEHHLLGQSLNINGCLTIAGDAAQQSDPTVVFRGWDDVLMQLSADGAEEARLTTNYRCPKPVADFSHKVLGSLAPTTLPHTTRDGSPVTVSHFNHEGLAIVAISDALTQLFDRERLASVAIICANEENAKQWHQNLGVLEDIRLVIDGDFSFKPGIDVTDVSQIKGLEFDYVIIPDANVGTYPDTAVARRTLHIAATRAVHQLWVIAVGSLSPILPNNP